MRKLVLIAAIAVALLTASSAAAYQPGRVTLHGYGGIATQVFTTENTFQLYHAIGWANSQRQLYVSIYPADWPNTQRTDIYLILPSDSVVPGTYTAAGGWAHLQPGLVFQGFGMGVFCDGGTFTIHSVDETSSEPEFDVSWSQVCDGSPVSGHAVFGDILPDTTPPEITVPADLSVPATGPAGASVLYAVTAMDDVDGSVPVTCVPPPGALFPIGDTTVECTASDAAGNAAEASFSVHVKGAVEQINDLMKVVATVGPPAFGLNLMLSRAVRAVETSQSSRACSELKTFERFVYELARPPKPQLTPGQASELTSSARRIRAVLACAL